VEGEGKKCVGKVLNSNPIVKIKQNLTLSIDRVSAPFLPTDLNADGVVNIQNITIVAVAYGNRVDGPK
jgi:hypothetical protein